MRTSTKFERQLSLLCLVFVGIIAGLVICLANECHKRAQYEQAACVLSDICHASLDNDDLNAAAFEEIYYDTVDNLDCYAVSIDKKFIENLHWAY